MITKYSNISDTHCVSSLYGLSTDGKPLYVCNASTFYEMDTGKLFMFSEESKEWIEQGGSGGGMPSGGAVMTTLYYAGVDTAHLWMNPEDVGNESKKLTYEDALKLKDNIIRLCMIYGESVITYACNEFSHYPEDRTVHISAMTDGVGFDISG